MKYGNRVTKVPLLKWLPKKTHTAEPNCYIITLSLLQVFLIPSALCYVFMAKKNVIDINRVKQTLRSRVEENFTSVNKH
jgi:hypothetical protein